jgi:hypothetical protein
MTTLCGIAVADGRFCTGLEVGRPLGVAVVLGLMLGVGDCAAGLAGEGTPGEAVVLLGSLPPEIRNPTPTAAPASTRAAAMIKINLPGDPLGISSLGPGG